MSKQVESIEEIAERLKSVRARVRDRLLSAATTDDRLAAVAEFVAQRHAINQEIELAVLRDQQDIREFVNEMMDVIEIMNKEITSLANVVNENSRTTEQILRCVVALAEHTCEDPEAVIGRIKLARITRSAERGDTLHSEDILTGSSESSTPRESKKKESN